MSSLKDSKVLGVCGTGCEISVFQFLPHEVCEVGRVDGAEGVVLGQSLRPQNCFVLCPMYESAELFGTLCLRV